MPDHLCMAGTEEIDLRLAVDKGDVRNGINKSGRIEDDAGAV